MNPTSVGAVAPANRLPGRVMACGSIRPLLPGELSGEVRVGVAPLRGFAFLAARLTEVGLAA